MHYVPASLENLMQVTAYVLASENDAEMRSIVQSANSWCKTKMIKKRLVKDMISQLERYEVMFSEYLHSKNITYESMASSLFF